MFEKEAEEIAYKLVEKGCVAIEENRARQDIKYTFQKGANFGYDKGYNQAKAELKDVYKESIETQNEFIIQLQKELEEEKKLNAEIKARFVKCNTCTDEMKSKCLMFTENLCEGERCEELIDIVSLVNKSDLERKIEELESQIEKMKCCGNCAKRGHICVAEEMQGNLCGKNKDKWKLRR